MRFPLSLAVIAFLQQSGCDQFQTKTVAPKPSGQKTPLHRFVLTRDRGDVAFDTQTGQICRTWPWVATSKPSLPDKDTGQVPETKWGESVPICEEIYHRYPSGYEDAAEIIPAAGAIHDDQDKK
jgi:hypothetical protein